MSETTKPNEPIGRRLDHLAILVRDTDEALGFYRDVLGLPVVLSEVIPTGNVRLTHLDLGNVHLQLVQPIGEDHPLRQHLDQHGEGLQHLCIQTDDVGEGLQALSARGLSTKSMKPHDAPRGRKAGFIDPRSTRGVVWELTGPM